MAPAVELSSIFKRYYSSCYYYDDDCGYTSNWYAWGRWVVLAGVLVVAFIIFLALACISSRRRRRRGAAPMYGTGWMAPQPSQFGQQPQQGQYYGQGYGQGYQQPAPAYDAQGQTPGQNQSYYGNPVQSPQPTYQSQYAPPQGPPPGKFN